MTGVRLNKNMPRLRRYILLNYASCLSIDKHSLSGFDILRANAAMSQVVSLVGFFSGFLHHAAASVAGKTGACCLYLCLS